MIHILFYNNVTCLSTGFVQFFGLSGGFCADFFVPESRRPAPGPASCRVLAPRAVPKSVGFPVAPGLFSPGKLVSAAHDLGARRHGFGHESVGSDEAVVPYDRPSPEDGGV